MITERPTVYLSGVSNDTTRRLASDEYYGRLGVLLGPETSGGPGGRVDYSEHLPDYQAWGMDNGCFSKAGAFDELTWLDSITRIRETVDGAWSSCLFAVAPDVFDPKAMKGDPLATIERSLPVLSKIRDRGVPAALVLQDGIEETPELIPWGMFDVAFLGGSDAFKLGYPSKVVRGNPHYEKSGPSLSSRKTQKWFDLLWEINVHGKGLHVGRVNSSIRMAFSQQIGADSADGTFLARAGETKGSARMAKWLDNVLEGVK